MKRHCPIHASYSTQAILFPLSNTYTYSSLSPTTFLIITIIIVESPAEELGPRPRPLSRAKMAKHGRNRHRRPGGEVLLRDLVAAAERRLLLRKYSYSGRGDLAPIRYVTLRGNARSCRPRGLLFASPRELRAVSVNCYVQTSLAPSPGVSAASSRVRTLFFSSRLREDPAKTAGHVRRARSIDKSIIQQKGDPRSLAKILVAWTNKSVELYVHVRGNYDRRDQEEERSRGISGPEPRPPRSGGALLLQLRSPR